MTVTMRPITAADHPFLFELYASTRMDELAVTAWTTAQKTAFLQQQFTAQHAHYTQLDHTAFDLLLRDGEPIGRLYVRRAPDEISIVDIALVPAARNTGIATALLGDLIAEATRTATPLRTHVEKHNPAHRLYERLGFRIVEDRGVFWFLQHGPP
jgi:ribosomal protein S18 acetylase RimI-like enzyme